MQEDTQKLLEEIDTLKQEVSRLNREIRKYEREKRVSDAFLERVTKASAAKDSLNNVLTDENAKQRTYTDMLLKNCPSIIILLDNDGRFVLSTEAFMKVTNTPNFDYIKNRKYEEVFSNYFNDDCFKNFTQAFNKVRYTADPIHFESPVMFPNDGGMRFYSFELRRTGDGQNTGILVVMIDFTDIMLEKQRAEHASAAKSDFLATMSHEIRTPMNAIVGMSDMLSRLELSAAQKRYVSDIKSSANVLLSIINDILDFSKIEARMLEITGESFNLIKLLHELESVFTIFSSEKSLYFEFLLSDNLPEVISGDALRIRQIIVNVLTNAVKYTKQGGVSFTAERQGDFLLFAVKDTGIGIRDEHVKKLFDPFEQFDRSKNKNIVGTGLGLAISYNLCHLMNGELWVESVYGEGSVFYIKIPYIEGNLTAENKDGDEISQFNAPEARVLVVDDIEINLAVSEALLSTFEITPDLAASGKEAIKAAMSGRYDIIFMDHMMPEMDGIEALKHIRLIDSYAAAPIIALTANAIVGMDKIFLQNGFSDFLPKPIDLKSLGFCLKKWLPAEIIIDL